MLMVLALSIVRVRPVRWLAWLRQGRSPLSGLSLKCVVSTALLPVVRLLRVL